LIDIRLHFGFNDVLLCWCLYSWRTICNHCRNVQRYVRHLTLKPEPG